MPTTDSKLYKPGAPFLEAAPQVQPVALWQFRWLNPGDYNNQSDEALAWKPVEPSRLQSLEDRVSELGAYRYEGKPCYEVRALYAAPPQPLDVQEQRDRAVASHAPVRRYDVLYEFAFEKRISYNELCAAVHSALSFARDCDSTTERATSIEAKQLREALEGLVRYVERNECQHEETHRGGAIWTICGDCGKQWADDRGGFSPYQRPVELIAADSALSGTEARQPEEGV